MAESVNSGEMQGHLNLTKEQGFFDKNKGLRWLILFLFMFVLFWFLQLREVRIEIPELDSVAQNYVVAQVDFDFHDQEATLIMKQEAVREIGKILAISEKQIHQRRLEFEHFFVNKEEWRKFEQEKNFENVYQGLEYLEKALHQLRFTDLRTLKKLREVGLSTEHYIIYTPGNASEGVIFPRQIWGLLRDEVFSGKDINKDTVDFLIKFFENKTWVLEEDIPTERQLRQKIQANVAEKFTHIGAGSRILNKGEIVTGRHIAMIQAMKQKITEKRNLWHPLALAGSFLMTLLITGICTLYIERYYPSIIQSNRQLFLLVSIVILTLLISKVTEYFFINAKGPLTEAVLYPIFIPIPAILISSTLSVGIATFVVGLLTILMGLTLAFNIHGFMIINFVAGLVTILSAHTLSKRKEIFLVCGKAWLSCVIVIFALGFYSDEIWSMAILADLISTSIFLLLTAFLVVGILPLLETTFGIMTDVTLSEYMDPNNELLRRLSIEAPGTYQHSIVVGNLAEVAALAIGANGLFCRVATLYHDIGKMATPQYFTENQQGEMDIHQLLTPEESAQVIMAHVSEGVAMARKAGLPEPFIDIIKEHHGTTLVYYFYHKQVEKMGGDETLVNEKDFRYAGPKPKSRESAIIMIADTVEAASRSLDVLNEESINKLADRLIRLKAEDGQFDECPLTFEELSTVKNILVKTLVAYGHSRIKYPEKQKKKVEFLDLQG